MGKSQNLSLILGCSLFLVVLCFAYAADTKTCPPNEFYTRCGDACQTKCSTLGKPCAIRYVKCPEGCYCNRGFARDSSGRCIPKSQCPSQ